MVDFKTFTRFVFKQSHCLAGILILAQLASLGFASFTLAALAWVALNQPFQSIQSFNSDQARDELQSYFQDLFQNKWIWIISLMTAPAGWIFMNGLEMGIDARTQLFTGHFLKFIGYTALVFITSWIYLLTSQLFLEKGNYFGSYSDWEKHLSLRNIYLPKNAQRSFEAALVLTAASYIHFYLALFLVFAAIDYMITGEKS